MKIVDILLKYRRKIIGIIIICAILFKIFIFNTKMLSIIHDTNGIIGLIIIYSGVFFRTWAAGFFRKNKTLFTTGPYHLCRHPHNFGSILIGCGFTMLMNSPYIWIFVILFILVIIPKIFSEERYLAALYQDEYVKYKSQTGLFFPKRLSLAMLNCHWTMQNWLFNKEYITWIAVIVSSIIIEAIQTITRS